MEDRNRQLKASLEGAVGRPGSIAQATWDRLCSGGAVSDYRRGLSSWEDLVDEVKEYLDYQDDLDQERLGRGSQTPESSKPSADEETEPSLDKKLSKQTKARAEALSEYYAFRTGEDAPTQAMRVKLRVGGPQVDGDIRQVIHMEVQAWVSPEEVRDVYRSVRKGLLEEKERIQAKPSTLEIAAFVWRQRRQALQEGRNLPSWATLKELWLQNHPDDKRVRGHGDFPRYFRRGAKAVVPRYRETLFPWSGAGPMKKRMIRILDAHIEKYGDRPFDEENQT